MKLETSATEIVDNICEYVKTKNIDGVVGYSDLNMMFAAIVSERCGLPGPKPESVFLCMHKYYSRVVEQPKLWFTGIDVYDDIKWKSEIRYPCWVKPVFMQATIGGQRINNENEMKRMIESFRERFNCVCTFYTDTFAFSIDKNKYPDFDKILLIAEELVEGNGVSQHCIDGWVDKDGNCHVFSIDDDEISDTTVFSFEMIPSEMSQHEWQVVETEGRRLLAATGLKSCAFVLEVFLRTENGNLRADTIEINHGATKSHTECYMGLFGTSPVCSAVFIACGEEEKAMVETEMMRLKNGKRNFALLAMFQARRSGYVSDIVDLDAIEYFASNKKEGVFEVAGRSGIRYDCSLSDYINLTEEGVRLGFFNLYGPDPSVLKDTMCYVRDKITKY